MDEDEEEEQAADEAFEKVRSLEKPVLEAVRKALKSFVERDSTLKLVSKRGEFGGRIFELQTGNRHNPGLSIEICWIED